MSKKMEGTKDWFPRLEEYTPNITKDEWCGFVQDKTVFDENALTTFACILKAEATPCADMAEQFGRNANFYNNAVWQTGKKIHEKTNCPLSERSEGGNRFWPVCCLGKYLQNGRFAYKIRPELQEVFEETGILEGVEVMEKNSHTRFWLINHTYEDANDSNRANLVEQAKENNYAFMQYEYNIQRNQVVSPTYKNAKQIQVGDYIFLRAGDFVYAFGKAIEPRQSGKTILNMQKIIDDKSCKYSSKNSKDVIIFKDAPVFYFDFSDGENGWGERIDVDQWMFGKSQIPLPKVNYIDDLPYPPIREIDKKSAEKILNLLGLPTMPTKTTTAGNYIDLLKNARNIIFHGAPGTGKTFLARQIAAEMKAETAFVQFHPSYDYTDFVEGLRPVKSDESGQIGFERKDGVFKEFCKRALKSQTVKTTVDNFDESWNRLVDILNETDFIDIPLLSNKGSIKIELNEYGTGLANRTYENNEYKKDSWINGKSKFFSKDQLYNIYRGLPGVPAGGHDNYRKAVVNYMKQHFGLKDYVEGSATADEMQKPFVFIIDEINRGDLSKIFGELFYSIDPGYRGKKGSIQTQYQNLIEESDVFRKGFFIPENVYIIGTMNDIDRSVETMDFAFRRRFTFVEITADSTMNMLDERTDENGNKTGLPPELAKKTKNRMTALNSAISKIEGFSSAYHIGGAYFLRLNELGGDFEKLWNYHLEPLLKEYLRGTENAEDKLEALKAAYDGEAETTKGEQAELKA